MVWTVGASHHAAIQLLRLTTDVFGVFEVRLVAATHLRCSAFSGIPDNSNVFRERFSFSRNASLPRDLSAVEQARIRSDEDRVSETRRFWNGAKKDPFPGIDGLPSRCFAAAHFVRFRTATTSEGPYSSPRNSVSLKSLRLIGGTGRFLLRPSPREWAGVTTNGGCGEVVRTHGSPRVGGTRSLDAQSVHLRLWNLQSTASRLFGSRSRAPISLRQWSAHRRWAFRSSRARGA